MTLVPLPPKSHSTTTPSDGSPGAACSAASAATESGISAAGTPFGARPGSARNAPRSAPTVAGAPVRGHRDRDGCTTADRAGHRVEGLGQHPLAAVRRAVGGHQRHRVTDPFDEAAQHHAGLR